MVCAHKHLGIVFVTDYCIRPPPSICVPRAARLSPSAQKEAALPIGDGKYPPIPLKGPSAERRFVLPFPFGSLGKVSQQSCSRARTAVRSVIVNTFINKRINSCHMAHQKSAPDKISSNSSYHFSLKQEEIKSYISSLSSVSTKLVFSLKRSIFLSVSRRIFFA